MYVCDICGLWLVWVGKLLPTVEHTRVRSVNAPRSQAEWRWALQGWWVSCLSSLGVAAFAAFAAVAAAVSEARVVVVVARGGQARPWPHGRVCRWQSAAEKRWYL